MKNILFISTLSLLLLFLNCAKTIIKVTNPAAVPNISQPNFKKTYINYVDGFVEYTRPVTPNKPQNLRGYTTKAEKERHVTPVCANDVEAIVIYPDFWDVLTHTILGGIISSRSVLVYCNR